MRKLFLLTLISLFAFSVFGQDVLAPKKANDLVVQKVLQKEVKIIPFGSKDIPVGEPIGLTNYDLQSNSAVARRMINHGDGTLSAVWLQYQGDVLPDAPERGTGYNFYDGSSWIYTGSSMSGNTTIEGSQRTGWPAISIDGEGNEYVYNHFTATGVFGWKQSVGASDVGWTQVNANNAEPITWPRTAQSGQNIVIIGAGESDIAFNTHNMVLIRSTDGGATFTDITSSIDYSNVLGVQGDSYAITARDNVFAFVVFTGMNDVTVWKSVDYGENWTPITIVDLPIAYNTSGGVLYDQNSDGFPDAITATDGTGDVIIDSEGKVHVVFPRMVNADDDPSGDGNSFFPYTDWILYWNEGMGEGVFTDEAIIPWISEDFPFIIDSLNMPLAIDTIGWCPDLNGNGDFDFVEVGDAEYPFGMYYGSLSSFTSMGIDADDNIYVAYSTVMEGDDYLKEDAAPNAQQYRHVWITKYNGESWGAPTLISDVDGSAENVYPSLAEYVDDNIHLWIQWDNEPGVLLKEDSDPVTDNYIVYKSVPVSEIPEGTMESYDVTFAFICGGDTLHNVDAFFGYGFKNSGASNELTYTNIYAGTYDYTMHRADQTDVEGTVTISGDQTIVIDFCPSTSYSVNFTVTDTTGNVVENAMVELDFYAEYTDVDGLATIENVYDGDYSCTVTADGYETYTSTVTVSGADLDVEVALVPMVAIDDVKQINVNIYPNPTSDYFTITNVFDTEIAIYDIVGNLVSSFHSNSNNQVINIEDFAAGTYIIKATNDQGTATKKIVKVQ